MNFFLNYTDSCRLHSIIFSNKSHKFLLNDLASSLATKLYMDELCCMKPNFAFIFMNSFTKKRKINARK
jgi:hypothetical protein